LHLGTSDGLDVRVASLLCCIYRPFLDCSWKWIDNHVEYSIPNTLYVRVASRLFIYSTSDEMVVNAEIFLLR